MVVPFEDHVPPGRRFVKYTIVKQCLEELWVTNFLTDELQLYRDCIGCYNQVYEEVEHHEFIIRHDAYDKTGVRLPSDFKALHVRKNPESMLGLLAFSDVYVLCSTAAEQGTPVWTYVPATVKYLRWKNHFLKGLNSDGTVAT